MFILDIMVIRWCHHPCLERFQYLGISCSTHFLVFCDRRGVFASDLGIDLYDLGLGRGVVTHLCPPVEADWRQRHPSSLRAGGDRSLLAGDRSLETLCGVEESFVWTPPVSSEKYRSSSWRISSGSSSCNPGSVAEG